MKKIFFILLIILPAALAVGLSSIDKKYFLCPIEYKRDIIIRSDGRGDGVFGAGRSGRRVHQGVDLLADIGTPVLACRSGMVISANSNRGMGNYVIIDHPGDLRSVYGHLSRIYVRQGQLVRQGQAIGAVGKTGNSNYRNILPHLHFEVRKNGIPQDPLAYLE